MIRQLKNGIWKAFTKVDALLKFPNLEEGEIGIQAGFDMAAPITTDVFLMYRRVKPEGLVIAIDADPVNISQARHLIDSRRLNIRLVHKALFSEKGKVHLALGESASWNQVNSIPLDSTVAFTGRAIEVEMDTLDHIVRDLRIDIRKIGHINLTINGAEYFALKGMKEILSQAEDLSLTIVAGRYDETGEIEGRPDHLLIMELLKDYGFEVKFRRIHQLFWWGFVVKTLLNRQWIYQQKNYGVVMAGKGRKKVKWYQSFS